MDLRPKYIATIHGTSFTMHGPHRLPPRGQNPEDLLYLVRLLQSHAKDQKPIVVQSAESVLLFTPSAHAAAMVSNATPGVDQEFTYVWQD